jgi:hypothetical protein
MRSRCPGLVVGTLSLIAVSILAGHAQSEEFQCRHGDLVRRIELRLADDADRLPCEVVYWRDQESPGEPRVPWKADHDLQFCMDKAREMVDGLQSAGWTCDGAALPSQDAAELDAIAPSAGPSREPAVEAARSPGEHAENGPPVTPDQATLQAALARDIRRLDELGGASSGKFKPEMTTLGDLNGDGVADGAVLLSHRDADGGSSHHLLAYLSDGNTFRPVARLNLESYYQNVTSVAIGEIADGDVELLLHTRRAGDPACCPSGRRSAKFELRDGQFVLVAESDSGA